MGGCQVLSGVQHAAVAARKHACVLASVSVRERQSWPVAAESSIKVRRVLIRSGSTAMAVSAAYTSGRSEAKATRNEGCRNGCESGGLLSAPRSLLCWSDSLIESKEHK